MEGNGSWHQVHLPPEPGFLLGLSCLPGALSPCTSHLSMYRMTPQFLPLAVPCPPQTPSFYLPPTPQAPSRSGALPPISFATIFLWLTLFPFRHWGPLLPSAAFTHLANMFEEPALSQALLYALGVLAQSPLSPCIVSTSKG